MTSSSGAKTGALSAMARIAASSAAITTARPLAARATSLASQGRKPAGTRDRVSGAVAVTIRCRASLNARSG